MINDGLDILREQLSLSEIMKLIQNTARWVSKDTFHYLPVWYPEEARRELLYKANWTEPQYNTNKTTGEKNHKRVGNTNANKALTSALGMRTKDRPNWTCCHIWSVDDPSFQRPNVIAGNKKFYSCVANMVLLPTPLKAFTDAMPEVKTMLRVTAAAYYGWAPEHEEIPGLEEDLKLCKWEDYPQSWPRERNDGIKLKGVEPFSNKIKQMADKRFNRVIKDLNNGGKFYPKEEVNEVLNYWSLQMPEFGKRLQEKYVK